MTASQNELLTRGASSYVGALRAIAAFRDEVREICQNAYDSKAPALLKAMGLEAEDCELYCSPKYLDDVGEEAELGVSRSAKSGNYFSVYLHWNEPKSESPDIEAAVCLEVGSRTIRNEILGKMKLKNPNSRIWDDVGERGYYLALFQPIRPVEPSTISKALDGLLLDWTRYCDSIGGLKLNGRA